MTIQLNLRMNEKLFTGAKTYAEELGYENIQDFIREMIREKVFEENKLTSKELELTQRIEKISDKKNLYGTEEDIKDVLRRKKNANRRV